MCLWSMWVSGLQIMDTLVNVFMTLTLTHAFNCLLTNIRGPSLAKREKRFKQQDLFQSDCVFYRDSRREILSLSASLKVFSMDSVQWPIVISLFPVTQSPKTQCSSFPCSGWISDHIHVCLSVCCHLFSFFTYNHYSHCLPLLYLLFFLFAFLFSPIIILIT